MKGRFNTWDWLKTDLYIMSGQEIANELLIRKYVFLHWKAGNW